MKYLRVTTKEGRGVTTYHLRDGREISFQNGDMIPVRWPDGTEEVVSIHLERREGICQEPAARGQPYAYDEPMVTLMIRAVPLKHRFMDLQLRIGEEFFLDQVRRRHAKEFKDFASSLPGE